MLELNEIAEMDDFCKSVDQLTRDLEDSTRPNFLTPADDISNVSSEDFLFIDDADDDIEEMLVNPMLGPSNLPKTCYKPPPVAPEHLHVCSMRRTMSVSSLQNQTSLQNVMSSVIPVFHTITEEKGDVIQEVEMENCDPECKPAGEEESVRRRSSRPRSSSLISSASLRSSLKKESASQLSFGPMMRNVSFSSIEIRPYEMTLGDHPCTIGPAMTLGWDYDEKKTSVVDVEEYEATREPRRSRKAMRMSANHRQYILMRESGFSRYQIKSAMLEARHIQKQRTQSAKSMTFAPLEEAFKRTKKRFSLFKKASKKI